MNEKELQAEHGVPEELPPAVNKPCNECPWRRESWAGYLGPMSAENWTKLAMGDFPIMCHKTIEESDNYEGTFQCRGAATFRANTFKEPRRPDVVTGPVDKENVFASTQEFINHHTHKGDDMGDERIVEEYEGWHNEDAVRYVGESTEELSEGEEGTIEINEVGSMEYGNLRTAIFFKPEGADEAITEVSPSDLEGI